MNNALRTIFCITPALALGACATSETQMDTISETGTSLVGELSGAAVQPEQGDPDGSGQFALWFDRDTSSLCYELGVTSITNATAAHIHRGGPDQTGPVVVPLQEPSPLHSEGCVPTDAALADEIFADPNLFYVQVHTVQDPQGALRAQLRPTH